MRRNLPPIPYESRTVRLLRRRQEHRELVEMSNRIAREVGMDTDEVINIASKLPGDPQSLRGIPVVGEGISGVSPGTKPGDGLA